MSNRKQYNKIYKCDWCGNETYSDKDFEIITNKAGFCLPINSKPFWVDSAKCKEETIDFYEIDIKE